MPPKAGAVLSRYHTSVPGLRQKATTDASVGSVTATLAKTPLAGNLLVALYAPRTTYVNASTLPAGWTEQGHIERTGSFCVICASKIAGASEPTSLTGQTNGQTITVTGSPTGGTFKLSDGTNTSAAINWNSTTAQTATALANATPSAITGWTVGGGTLPASAQTFTTSAHGAPRALLTLANNSLTGGTSPSVTIAATVFYQALDILEIGGLNAAVIDQIATKDGGAGTLTTLALNPITLGAAPAIVLAAMATGGSPGIQTWAWDSGLTAIAGSAGSQRLSAAYKGEAATETITPTATWTTAQTAAGLVASFKGT